MAPIQYPHFFVPESAAPKRFKTTKIGRDNAKFPDREDHKVHGAFIRKALDAAWKNAEKTTEERRAISLPTRAGTYYEFESAPELDLKTKSLDIRKSGIDLRTVTSTKNDQGDEVTRATIFVPTGKEALLVKKIDAYTESEIRDNKKPKHNDFLSSINNLREAILESFWRDDLSLIPKVRDRVEVWLQYREDPEPIVQAFKETCDKLGVSIEEGHLLFPERAVVIIDADQKELRELILSNDHVAEFRRAKATAEFWTELDNSDQSDAASDLASRISVNNPNNISVCVIDTGVNNGHILLKPILDDEDCHTVDPEWGVNDNDGHGTLMSGVVAFGTQLDPLLQTSVPIEVPYSLESVKLIPGPGKHHAKQLYGYRTQQAISRAEIQAADRSRISCLAVSTEDGRDEGRPSSWSGSLDQLCFGTGGEPQRLIVVAAGNVQDSTEWRKYPDSNATLAVHDPGQSWNALTIGAYTEKDEVADPHLKATYKPIAPAGGLSPYSTTSLIWDQSKWPNKPDVVFEGGNAGFDEKAELATQLDDLAILTTNAKPQEAQFATINATSAACALASNFAANLSNLYPDAWPETLRGLIVHSADWTPTLLEQISIKKKTDKSNYKRLLRTCGYGVPRFAKAAESASHALTLICEQTIQPFQPKGDTREYETKDMHLVELPWPEAALKELPSETPVTINVTLSYFIEPGPGEIGWRDKYRYRSHGLDFEIKPPTESTDEFLKKLNKAAQGDEPFEGGASAIDWVVGSQARNKGSVHRDWWETTAEEAAATNVIGIFPRTGWWKERHHLRRGESSARYSLIVSLSTPKTEIDIYTPVQNMITQQIKAASSIS